MTDRRGQVWENAAGLIVLVVRSDASTGGHTLLVLRSWSEDPRELRPGSMHWWDEPDDDEPWERSPMTRHA